MTGIEEVFEVKDPTSEARIDFDVRAFPYFIAHWIGTPTVPLVDGFLQARRKIFERAVAEGAVTVQITDLSNFGTPTAVVRKHLGAVGKVQDDEFSDVFAGYVLVVPNAVIRGVITALTWIAGDNAKPTAHVGSLHDAFSKDHSKTLGVDLRTAKYVPR